MVIKDVDYWRYLLAGGNCWSCSQAESTCWSWLPAGVERSRELIFQRFSFQSSLFIVIGPKETLLNTERRDARIKQPRSGKKMAPAPEVNRMPI